LRSHFDTLRIRLLQIEARLWLGTEHFLVLPAIVKATDLSVVMPRNFARLFAVAGGYAHHRAAFSAARLHGVAALEPAFRARPRQPVAAPADRGLVFEIIWRSGVNRRPNVGWLGLFTHH
jgi:hypothetical protein